MFFCRYVVHRVFGAAIWALVALLVLGSVYVVVSRPRLVELAAGRMGLGSGRCSTSVASFKFLVVPFSLRIFAGFPRWRVSSEFFRGRSLFFWTDALFANFAADSWSSPRTPYFPAFDAYTKNFLVASAQISSQHQLMGCLGLAGLVSSVTQHFGICRPSETKFDTLLRAHCRVGSLNQV